MCTIETIVYVVYENPNKKSYKQWMSLRVSMHLFKHNHAASIVEHASKQFHYFTVRNQNKNL